MKIFISLLALLLSLIYAMPLAANPTEIRCPTTQVEAEITTNLRSGWTHEATAHTLQWLDIEEIGDQRQLVCLYGESLAFKTSLPEPQLQTCQVQQADKKFICNPTPPSISGSVVISEVSARLDLVTGRTRRPFEPDVLFDQYQNGLLRVIPRRRATIKMRRVRRYGCTGRIPGNLEINLRANSSRGSLLRRRDYERSIFCVTTNEGRVSEFIITHPNPNSSNLEISYKTW